MDKRLQQFLDAEDISQTQLAGILGVARASISHIISGRNKPGFDFICNFAEHFPAVSLDWLISGKGRMYRSDSMATQASPASPAAGRPVHTAVGQAPSESGSDNLFDDSLFNDSQTLETLSTVPASDNIPDSFSSSSNVEDKDSLQLVGNTSKLSAPCSSVSKKIRTISRIIALYDDGSFQELT